MFETTTRFDEEDSPNPYIHVALLDYVKKQHPRVLFVGYGETDNWAHQGRYDLVLDSAHRVDGFIKQLWDTMQAMPQYRGTTTFIVTADHGRGSGPEQWREHGVEEAGSQNVWMAVIGPDTAPLGERHDIQPVVQAQIAATVAALIGKDYRRAVPAAAAPLTEVLGSKAVKNP
jgi:bisphosphoglycerate-independent phosphoglycerate mutase (AlkP superfamily)